MAGRDIEALGWSVERCRREHGSLITARRGNRFVEALADERVSEADALGVIFAEIQRKRAA